jgi:outer membrane usher protein
LQSDLNGGVAGFLEAGASHQGVLLYSGASRNFDGSVVRGLSSVTYDQPGELRRFVLGDAVAGASVLGGSSVLLGFSISREFSLDPYFIRGPLPTLQGFALTPSKVDLYVNGVLVKQDAVKAGQFDLLNLPLATGDSAYRAVIRDAFGREQEVTGRYYFSSGLLAKGLRRSGIRRAPQGRSEQLAHRRGARRGNARRGDRRTGPHGRIAAR